MTIYERIKMLRVSQNMSQEELARRVGYKSRSSINKIELGERDINQTKIKQFADVFGVSPNYLISGDEKPIVYDAEARRLIERVRTSDGMRMLFSVAEDCPEEDIRQAIKIIEALKNKE